ncbi:MAG: relaxase/mobilization nuclease domain-containing protein [Enterococcus sp.]|nr:relaxase/mobilization nuclease domain-containing protein [Enterococcus sp.]
MATVKVSSSKTCANAINYAKNKAVIMNGLNVDPKYAIGQMEHVRHVYDKTDGVQAHLFIQSFAPGEVTPQQANDIGIELAQAISEDKHYQVAVYTHNDTKHIHNHLVLNAVDFETGLKYQQSFDVKRVRELSDHICEQHDLSVIYYEQADRKPISEIKAKEKGHFIWKDELRERITLVLNDPYSVDLESLKKRATDYDLDIRFRGKGVSYAFVDSNGKKRVSRGAKLGDNYNIDEIHSSLRYNKTLADQALKEFDLEPINQEIKDKEKQVSTLKKKIEELQPSIKLYRKWEVHLHTLSQKRFNFIQFKEKAQNVSEIEELTNKVNKNKPVYDKLTTESRELTIEKERLIKNIANLKERRFSIQKREKLRNKQLEEGFNMNRVKQLDKEIRSTHQPQTKQRSRGLSR